MFPYIDRTKRQFWCGATRPFKTKFMPFTEDMKDVYGHFQFYSENDTSHWGKTESFPISMKLGAQNIIIAPVRVTPPKPPVVFVEATTAECAGNWTGCTSACESASQRKFIRSGVEKGCSMPGGVSGCAHGQGTCGWE